MVQSHQQAGPEGPRGIGRKNLDSPLLGLRDGKSIPVFNFLSR